MKQVRTVRLVASAAVALIAVLALAAASPAKPTGRARAQSHNVLGLPGIPPVFLGVRPYVAQQRGYYKKWGADVELKQFTTGTDALRAVQAGQIDLAWAPTPTTMSLMSRGAPLVGIEGMDVIDWLVGSVDPSVTTCAALKGDTIAVHTGG